MLQRHAVAVADIISKPRPRRCGRHNTESNNPPPFRGFAEQPAGSISKALGDSSPAAEFALPCPSDIVLLSCLFWPVSSTPERSASSPQKSIAFPTGGPQPRNIHPLPAAFDAARLGAKAIICPRAFLSFLLTLARVTSQNTAFGSLPRWGV